MIETTDYAINVKDLSFRYRKNAEETLNGLQFSQKAGTLKVIMGPTGAGKTTFLRMISGQIPQFYSGISEGTIDVFGRDPRKTPFQMLADTIGMVFQNFESQIFCTNVAQEVAFGLENFCIPHDDIKTRVNESLSVTGLLGYEDRDPSTLSGGEKQRLALASILALKPKILLLDEPTTDLDPASKQELFSFLVALKKQGMTILVVEHESEEILVADSLAIFDKGRIVDEGKPRDVIMKTSLLTNKRIVVPDLSRIFNHCGIKEYIDDIMEVKRTLDEQAYFIDEKKYQNLLFKDEKKKHSYGKEVIAASNLSFHYNQDVPALKNVNLRVKEGEFLAIVGKNGSGKTTLVKTVLGLLRPDAGRIAVKSKNIAKQRVSDIGKIIGFVFQDPDYQIFSPTVEEEVAFAPKNFGVGPLQTGQSVEKSLKVVGLWEKRKQDPFVLTKGERQRVAIASVLAAKPEVLIFDEPTTGLDSAEIRQVMNLLNSLNKKGHTIIIVTHSLWVVNAYAHRIVAMDKGYFISDKEIRAFYNQNTVLEQMGLRTSPVIALAHLYKKKLITADDFFGCLEKGEEGEKNLTQGELKIDLN